MPNQKQNKKMENNEMQDHIDRFAEVADGLGLPKLIANKIANFIHYEVMSAKREAHSEIMALMLTEEELVEIIIETESTSDTRDWDREINLKRMEMKKERNRTLIRINEIAKAIHTAQLAKIKGEKCTEEHEPVRSDCNCDWCRGYRSAWKESCEYFEKIKTKPELPCELDFQRDGYDMIRMTINKIITYLAKRKGE